MLKQIINKVDSKTACLTIIGLAVSLGWITYFKRKQQKHIKKIELLQLIGNTPLIYLSNLSKALGCEVYLKCECFNPFGSSKDRAVKKMISQAQKRQKFINKRQVIQASSGSTAISLVQLCHILKIKPSLYLPNDLAQDKYTYLETLGANIIKVPPVSIVDSKHFYNLANSTSQKQGSFFMNQFQNLDNAQVHYQSTAPQIYKQTNGLLDSFVCSAGTGGTIAGISKYLKEKNNKIKIILADPEGSGLFNKVKYNVLFTNQQKQGYRLKNPFDTVIQGVGLNRPTKNFDQAIIDDAYKIKDIEALHMAHYLIQNQGLFLGGSTALNIAAVVKYSRKNKSQKIVTIAHDLGNRYLKKFYSEQYLKQKGINFVKKQKYEVEDLSFIQ